MSTTPDTSKTQLPTPNYPDWQQTAKDLGGRTEEFVRKEPAQAIGAAFLIGLLLTVLPIGRVVGGLIRLTFALVRPLLLILGAVKLWDEFEKRNQP